MPNPFIDFKEPYQGQKHFDKYYVKPVKHVVYKQISEGIYEPIEEIEEEKIDIAQSIEAQMPDAGLDAYLKPYELSGTTPPGVNVEDKVQDFSEFPEDLAGAIDLGVKARQVFDNLDPELKQGHTYEEFIQSINEDTLKRFIESKFPKAEEKKEEKKSEVKEDGK